MKEHFRLEQLDGILFIVTVTYKTCINCGLICEFDDDKSFPFCSLNKRKIYCLHLHDESQSELVH